MPQFSTISRDFCSCYCIHLVEEASYHFSCSCFIAFLYESITSKVSLSSKIFFYNFQTYHGFYECHCTNTDEIFLGDFFFSHFHFRAVFLSNMRLRRIILSLSKKNILSIIFFSNPYKCNKRSNSVDTWGLGGEEKKLFL